MHFLSVLLVAVLGCSSAKPTSRSQSELMRVQLSSAEQVDKTTDFPIPFSECGYIFCEAPDVTIDNSTHYWDYYVDWEVPAAAIDSSNVFVLANKFQMPRSYLVFRTFNGNYIGDYKCVLYFRKTPIASHTVRVSISDKISTNNCATNHP